MGGKEEGRVQGGQRGSKKGGVEENRKQDLGK
jgi:hypothetical protein